MSAPATGWTVIQDDVILVRTVGPTKLSAQVNGLLTVFNMQVSNWIPDAVIDRIWASQASAQTGVRLARCSIRELPE